MVSELVSSNCRREIYHALNTKVSKELKEEGNCIAPKKGNKKMKRPCVALDVSKGSSHYQGWINEDKKLGNPKKIEHNQEGFREILAKAKELEGITNEKPIVVFEATGVYHRTLQHFLEENGMDYIIVSPLASAKVRKSNIRSTKTDKKDCRNIAKVYYSKNLKVHGKGDEIYERMLDLNRYYQYLTSQLKKVKVQFRLVLDIVFPNIDKLWAELYGEVPMAILRKCSHPNQLRSKNPETLARYLMKETCHHYGEAIKEANRAIEYCKACCSGCSEASVNCQVLKDLVSQLSEKTQEQDNCLNQIIDLAKGLPNYELLLSVPGISDNLASRIIAELGDLGRFSRVRQITAYAGLDPNIYQSGQICGLHLKITKKGNKNLRCLLYLAIQNTLKKENKVSEFYHKKIAAGMNPKAAKIACMNKLLRIIYSMCKNGCFFQ